VLAVREWSGDKTHMANWVSTGHDTAEDRTERQTSGTQRSRPTTLAVGNGGS